MNWFSWLLLGAADVLTFVLNLLPTPLPAVRQTLSAVPTILYFAAGPLLTIVGSFVNLKLFLTVLSIIALAETARVTLSIWRFIMKNLPALLGGN